LLLVACCLLLVACCLLLVFIINEFKVSIKRRKMLKQRKCNFNLMENYIVMKI